MVFQFSDEAMAEGFRPCLKCRPIGPDEAVTHMVKLARAIQADASLPWNNPELALFSGISARRVGRQFRQVMGISPRAFRDAVRLRVFKSALRDGVSVTHAGFDAGYSGAASRHDAAKGLGMTAQQYAQLGKGMQIEAISIQTDLGLMTIGATTRGVCHIHFIDPGEHPLDYLKADFPQADISEADADSTVQGFARAVEQFLDKGGPRPDLPLDLYGTAFQIKVWDALCTIPKGEVRTYGALAAEIGHPGAARAVGSANAKNRVPVIVPCHLVVAMGGKLGGYSSGLDRKRKLLALEGV